MSEGAFLFAIGKASDVDDFSTTASAGKATSESQYLYFYSEAMMNLPISLSTRESQLRQTEHECTACINILRRDDINTPIERIHRVETLRFD